MDYMHSYNYSETGTVVGAENTTKTTSLFLVQNMYYCMLEIFQNKKLDVFEECVAYLVYTSSCVKADRETSCFEETYLQGVSVPEN